MILIPKEKVHQVILAEDKHFYDRKYEILALGCTDSTEFISSIMKSDIETKEGEQVLKKEPSTELLATMAKIGKTPKDFTMVTYSYHSVFAKSEDKLYKISLTYNHLTGRIGASVNVVTNIALEDLGYMVALKNENSSLFYSDELMAYFCLKPSDTVDEYEGLIPLYVKFFYESDEKVNLALKHFDGYLSNEIVHALKNRYDNE